jgi:hypothetical protein
VRINDQRAGACADGRRDPQGPADDKVSPSVTAAGCGPPTRPGPPSPDWAGLAGQRERGQSLRLLGASRDCGPLREHAAATGQTIDSVFEYVTSGLTTGVASMRPGEAGSLALGLRLQLTGSEDAMSTSPRGRPDRTKCRVAPSALALLESARDGLAAGQFETSAASRYVAAHLAALRAAAAIVAARPEPGTTGRRRRPRSVWELLTRAEPALSEWAAFFAAGAAKRAAAEAGLSRAVSLLEADDLIRDAGTFVTLAEDVLGISVGWPLPIRTAS